MQGKEGQGQGQGQEKETSKHRLYEDGLALILGTLFVSFGLAVYAKTMLLVGSMAGLSLLIHYISGLPFALVFFLANLPFYFLAWKRLGPLFALRTFVAVGLVSLFSRLTGDWVAFAHLDPLYATVLGGGITGTGLLMLFRHRTGLGGINILAIYLQEKFGIRAGWFQMGVDLAILGASFFVLSPENIVLSVVGAVIVNMIVAINHKPGRYLGMTWG